ncbi:hypothetical protein [Streptomyces sp. WMMC1477]|uniref:hypothetical protein n=1 Tax=Streptomyces sp. WMMC1477 TaxID=3015155 RepID=UPI0022B61BA4|nr:hypothetical protein [Streptomyces sp. WMMC1477]MCZ7430470.1 hypothetical protein [Streptomyces sp. WMMC1477]
MRRGPRGPSSGAGAALLAGVAVGVTGAVLTFAEPGPPLRAPLTSFFLLAAPGAALAVALRGLDPLSRSAVALAGSIAVNLLVAQVMLATRSWSVRGGVTAIAVLSTLALLTTALGARARRRGAGGATAADSGPARERTDGHRRLQTRRADPG